MLKSNNFLAGVIAGSVLPGISLFVFFYLLKSSFLILNKPGIPYLIAIALNMLITRYCFSKQQDKTGMGFILITFIFMASVFLFKLQPIK